ncbi:MAG: LacI family transcriptional regulator [Flavobacteriaceae bacterium]|nr:LacI family transcriptional regulator [Flavobacteriaceae bacterium]
MNQNKITLKQLAIELNVSISTVSKALKNSHEINEKTIKKIKALAKKYNYRPNKTALNLKNRQTKTIGVIIPNILNYFFAKVLLGIEEVANSNGYQIIICLSNNQYKKEVACLNLLCDGSVDGFILSIAKETQFLQENTHFKNVIDEGYPIVMFDRVSNEIENCDKVIIDDVDAAYKATNYLLDLNCKKIALVSTIDDIAIGKLRVKGYNKAITENSNYNHKPILISIDNKMNYETIITSLFEMHNNIDGILATDSVSAVTALKVANKKGYHVPNDINIIGFSDDKISRLSSPTLTTVNQHALDIGKNVVNLLLSRLRGLLKINSLSIS